jgi:protoporphyrinogen oxidase
MRVAIIGGGITGLTVAYELSKQGKEVVVYEKDKQLGGLVKSYQKDNWDWPVENFFHHYFTQDKELKSFLSDLGIAEKLFYQSVETSVYTNGEIYPFDNPIDYLNFPYLDFLSKARMGGVIFLMRLLPYLPIYHQVLASKFFPKLIGQQAWETVWQPLMQGKFSDQQEKVAFSWLWARIKARSVQLGYIKGGSQVLIDHLSKKLKEQSVPIKTNQEVRQIQRKEKQWEVTTNQSDQLFDKVVLAVPMPQAMSIIDQAKSISGQKKVNFRNLKSIASLVLVLRLKKGFLPDQSYWLNILDKQFPFVALVEHTNFIDSRYYNDEHLVYVGGYYQQNNPILDQNKKEIFKQFSPYLRRLNPSFENFLIGYDLFKYPWAQPVIEVNYPQKKPDYELVPGQVYWATANHIFPWDRGLNNSIEMGRELSRLV